MAICRVLAVGCCAVLAIGCATTGGSPASSRGLQALLGCYALRLSGEALGTYDGPVPARLQLTTDLASPAAAVPRGQYAAQVGFWGFTSDSVVSDSTMTPTWSPVPPDSLEVNFGWEHGLLMRARVIGDSLNGGVGTMARGGFWAAFHVTGLRNRCQAASHADPRT